MTGLLLINLGTPKSPTSRDVASYLREFLMDPYVVDIPTPLRWVLVNLIIAPIRSPKSAAAYSTVWTEKGSPLLVHHLSLRDRVREALGPNGVVEAAMRYAEPSIETVVAKMKQSGVDRLLVLPLYPQYAESTTRSSIECVQRALDRLNWAPKVEWVEPFFGEDLHIKAWEQVILRSGFDPNNSKSHLLLSYHGLPERHLQKTGQTQVWCLDGGKPTQAESRERKYNCCERIAAGFALRTGSDGSAPNTQPGQVDASRFCYRAQCLVTSQKIARRLGLKADQWSMSFQSRLGRTPWIRPYTDEVIPALAKQQGLEHLFVATPSFVADCLETIEEIGDRAKELFTEAGGTRFTRVPCVNDDLKDFVVSLTTVGTVARN